MSRPGPQCRTAAGPSSRQLPWAANISRHSCQMAGSSPWHVAHSSSTEFRVRTEFRVPNPQCSPFVPAGSSPPSGSLGNDAHHTLGQAQRSTNPPQGWWREHCAESPLLGALRWSLVPPVVGAVDQNCSCWSSARSHTDVPPSTPIPASTT